MPDNTTRKDQRPWENASRRRGVTEQKKRFGDFAKAFYHLFYPIKGLCAFDFAGAQATRTNILVLGGSVNHNFDFLQIRFPNSFAMFVGVRNGIAGDNAFFAYKAFLSHYFNLP